MPKALSDLYAENKFDAGDFTPAFQFFARDPDGATPAEELGASDFTELLKAFFSKPWGITVQSSDPAVAIANGTYGPIPVPHNMTLTAVQIVAIPITGQTVGNITFDVYVDTYANFPPTVGDSIIGAGTKPALAGAVKMRDTDLSDYTTLNLPAGSEAYFVVSGASNLRVAKLTFDNVRTA